MFTRFQLWRATVGLSIFLTIAPKPGHAVDPDQPATSYLRTTFTVEDGLSSNVVNAILQTRDGFLWIGTDAGLNRFDGTHFTPIYFRGPKSTSQGIVSALAEGPDGDLWIGTSAGLVRVSRRAFDQFDRSLSVFYHPGESISDEITRLHVSRDGTLWVGTSAGLYRFVANQFKTVIPNAVINRIEESVDGHLHIVTNRGFVELDGTRVIEHPGLSHQLGIGPGAFFHVFQDRNGAIWFCTSMGLARRVNGSIERLQPYGPEAHGVYGVYEDPQGNLWVEASTSAQSTGGILRVSGTKLESLAPSIQVRAVSADREGNLWLGTNGEGLVRFKDRPIRMFTKADGLPNNVPMTVLSKRDGSLWVGNNCGGLSVFNGERFKTYDEKDGLSNSCVWALAEGKGGELWVGTWGGGLFRFAHNHFAQFTSPQGLAGDIVRAITVARDGSLWIATDGGLSHMLNKHFHNYTTADGLSSNRVVSVYQDRHGAIWVETSRGINRMTGDRFAPVLSPHEIFDPRYISLEEDSSGELYALSAPMGIDRIEENQS
jgi:ligand-binding sensor domain-containing protein